MHTHTHTHIHTHTHAHTHAHTHTHTHTGTHTHRGTHAHTHTHMHTYAHTHTPVTIVCECVMFTSTVISPHEFTIGDTSRFQPYQHGGVARQLKVPRKIAFVSMHILYCTYISVLSIPKAVRATRFDCPCRAQMAFSRRWVYVLSITDLTAL